MKDVARIEPALARMAERGVALLVHGEVTSPDVDIFDREAVFIDRILAPLIDRHPTIKVVLEHVTTREGVDFVRSAADNVAATITPQHLLYNRNALFAGGLRPHRYCLPVLKAETHRTAVLQAAVSGHPGFFLGTDSAPHPRHAKESPCGCAGIYSAHAALALYADIFERAGALDRLNHFAAKKAERFYGLPPATGNLRLKREPWRIPENYRIGGGHRLVPLGAGEVLQWKLA